MNDTATAETPRSRTERLTVSRRIAAGPSAIFAVLCDPTLHRDTEPTDWVREAIDPAPITAVDQVFAMQMFHVGAGGGYVMHNRVTVFEPERAIGWMPGGSDSQGKVQAGGWWWRYDLTPATAGGTDVQLTYDWSAAGPEIRKIVPLPAVDEAYLNRSLETLAGTVAGSRTG